VRRRKKQKQDRPLIVQGNPKAVASEAFRTLRTNLQFTSPDREIKTILITSAAPGDGKSTVSSNLSAAWAQSGSRVLLLSCDLRRPILHQIFGIRNTPGLTGYLTGRASLDAVIVPTSVPNLDFIPSGPVPPNPAELLQSKAMRQCFKDLRERYDVVICDGTPVIAVTDAAVVASQTDGTVLVVEAGETPKDVAAQAVQLLERAKANILGVVLNRVAGRGGSGYYYYHYHYYYSSSEAE
jgi:capsular exopolysaccharide synthesis family protein